ncbi:MAG: Kazal-type serine protease inhibitor [Candidatus Micrarchaeota archaeon]|nr:Kazal-type serine protease inhibitor [Candidatus Micrarchaeota archaeon]
MNYKNLLLLLVVLFVGFAAQGIKKAEQISPTERLEVCIEIYEPVCGVDGKTYPNRCYAEREGVKVAHPGECKSSEPVERSRNIAKTKPIVRPEPINKSAIRLAAVIYLSNDIVVDFDVVSGEKCVFGNRGNSALIGIFGKGVQRVEIDPQKCYVVRDELEEVDCKKCSKEPVVLEPVIPKCCVVRHELGEVENCKKLCSGSVLEPVRPLEPAKKIEIEQVKMKYAGFKRIEIDNNGKIYVIVRKPVRLFVIDLPIEQEEKVAVDPETVIMDSNNS